jgi:hypothetical protein
MNRNIDSSRRISDSRRAQNMGATARSETLLRQVSCYLAAPVRIPKIIIFYLYCTVPFSVRRPPSKVSIDFSF